MRTFIVFFYDAIINECMQQYVNGMLVWKFAFVVNEQEVAGLISSWPENMFKCWTRDAYWLSRQRLNLIKAELLFAGGSVAGYSTLRVEGMMAPSSGCDEQNALENEFA